MNPYVITACIVALLLIFLSIRAVLKISNRNHMAGRAAVEYKAILESIKLADTFTEAHFWLQEAYSFIDSYKPHLNHRLLLTYKTMLFTAYNARCDKGFYK
jgi:hypothetical protein